MAVIRHPMPYSDLIAQRIQRFASLADLDAAGCTVEEREEYEPHLALGTVVYAGVDYAAIVEAASREADVIVWDGGNNDFPFVRPDLHIVVADALRPDDARGFYPGEAVLRTADVIVVNKANAARSADVERAIAAVRGVNASAPVVCGAMPTRIEPAVPLRGRRVLVVEDGPTITHGGLPHGAGFVAATAAGAIIVDPRPALAPALRAVFETYPHIGPVLPAVGYSPVQRQALRETIDRSDADVVLSATPIDLRHVVSVNKPILRVRYEFADPGTLTDIVDDWLSRSRPESQETAK